MLTANLPSARLPGKRAVQLLMATLVLTAVGCDHVERPNRPFPTGLSASTLEGAHLDRESLAGRPWVIQLWVPG